jgi:hypothetical protein
MPFQPSAAQQPGHEPAGSPTQHTTDSRDAKQAAPAESDERNGENEAQPALPEDPPVDHGLGTTYAPVTISPAFELSKIPPLEK